jgi:hypothetical protein
VKHHFGFAGTFVLSACCTVFAQGPDSSSQTVLPQSPQPAPAKISQYEVPPLSRMSFGAGLSTLGIALQASTDINAHLNVRGVGNAFTYSTSFNTSGIPISANLNMGTGGVMLDYYPFHVGFRLSGGALFVNQNKASATADIPAGNSFTLNHQTYYSANANAATGTSPLTGTGTLALNTTKPGGILTTGWGNHVKRSGHLAFPVEIGAAFVGAPKVNMALSGWACTDQAQTMCTDIASTSNPIAVQFQNDLNSQISKWNSNLNVLTAYPILSFGVSYSFQTRAY